MFITERNARARRRVLWEVAEDRLDQIAGWCKTVAMNLEEMFYQQKRLTLDALGVKARIYRAGRLPRYEIEATIPMGEDQTVFNTR